MTTFRDRFPKNGKPPMPQPQGNPMAMTIAMPLSDGQLAAMIAGNIVAHNIQTLTGPGTGEPLERPADLDPSVPRPDWRMLVTPELAARMAVTIVEATRLLAETNYPATVRDRLYDTLGVARPKTPEQEAAEEEERRRLADEEIERERAERTRRELSGEPEPPASPPNLSLEG